MHVPYLFRLFWIAPMVGGAILALASWQAMVQAEASTQWTRVDGEITRPFNKYDPQYVWEYNGQRYTGDQLACCGGNRKALPAQGTQPNTRVDVYVNPDNPAEAVLLPGVQPTCMVRIVIGIGLIAAGVWVRRRIIAGDDLASGRRL